MSLGERLKKERERLGFSQSDFAEMVGASRKSQIRWEKDESAPGADAISLWAKAGLDVLYLITGQVQQSASTAYKNSEIDAELLGKIVHKLDSMAQQANRRWTPDELVLQSSKIYNFLIKESVVDDSRIDRVLKLVVNH
ncbi:MULTISPECIES: helix-turn-helix domain-containing protein [Photorhabdus]|uniref:Helix-turn-helix domain-containing protein n=4 Tax=Photorhabdus TaxID=29487 RepID=A0ABX0B9I2_9GAMM|nr:MULTISPECIES: helix-turn-helix transcriptional regulator [Photorhabdus]MBS9433848.1 helix-turn-helix domain-containing protein [Photorhabdus hainanensis]MCC8374018.1 helix-turn-helix domain-containing protein [Photorhabdus bodei]MCT8348855.1 helix-turn-helix domain-containing protein [Photorhabdus temperata]MDB6371441.1 helix-turn-helix domain-containing protein [Photorhabdus bodei]NDL14116.1 helix-turn-helix domain-containing protein [Photorhabdus kayaii]